MRWEAPWDFLTSLRAGIALEGFRKQYARDLQRLGWNLAKYLDPGLAYRLDCQARGSR